jgi:hypothetical protein
MSRILTLCAGILFLSLTVGAQDFTAALDTTSPTAEAAAPAPVPVPASLYPSERYPWQLGMGFQYQHYNTLGFTFHDEGFNTDLTRYLNNWFGTEFNTTMGYGHTGGSPSFVAKSFFVGGGPHVAVHNGSKFEPWGHVLIGLERFRFTEYNSGIGSNSALGFMVGGGVDYKLYTRVYFRIQADYLGTHFQSAMQKNYSGGAGFVFNF